MKMDTLWFILLAWTVCGKILDQLFFIVPFSYFFLLLKAAFFGRVGWKKMVLLQTFNTIFSVFVNFPQFFRIYVIAYAQSEFMETAKNIAHSFNTTAPVPNINLSWYIPSLVASDVLSPFWTTFVMWVVYRFILKKYVKMLQ